MRSFLSLLAIPLLAACASPNERRVIRSPFDPVVDQICALTGMKRSGPIRSVKRDTGEDSFHRGKYPGYALSVDLAAGRVRRYHLFVDDRVTLHRPFFFQPDGFTMAGTYDRAVNDPKIKAMCIASVRRFNREAKIPYHGKLGVSTIHRHIYWALASSISNEQEDCSFIVTQDGQVMACFFGR